LPSGNKPKSDSGFAKLLATPDEKPAPVAKPDDANKDNVAMLAASPAATPAQPAAKPADDAKPSADALRGIDLAKLRDALAQTAPAQQVKPGTPTLPVMPVGGDEDGDGEPATLTPKDFAAKLADTLAANGAAPHMTRPVPPVQTTQAQALPIRFDTKSDSQNGGADANGKGSPDDQNGQSHTAPNTAAANNQAAAPQIATHTPAAAPQAALPANSATLSGNTAANGVVSTSLAQPGVGATLHIAQAAQTAANPQPNIAALAITVAANSQAGIKHFDIRLDPPELGRIEVHLSVDDAGKAQVHLSADKPQTLELLQRDSTALHRGLKEAGVDVAGNGLQFSLRGQERDDASKSHRGRALAVSAVAEAGPVSTDSHAPDSARLDIRV